MQKSLHHFFATLTTSLIIQLSANFSSALANDLQAPCCIRVVEKGTRWPVPMVELTTVHNVLFVSDNAGRIAFDLPELMGQETWFAVESDGYEVPADKYGRR